MIATNHSWSSYVQSEGQNVNYFKHPNAIVESTSIGDDTKIWAFSHVLPGAKIGKDCNICDHTFVENDVIIGDRVTVKCGVQLWDGVALEDDVFVGRVRQDPFVKTGLWLWIVADNLRKGAATNAVQIAEELLKKGLI